MATLASQLMIGVGADTGPAVSQLGGLMSMMGGPFGAAAAAAAALVVGVGAASVKMAADFQTGVAGLVTGAGESASNIKMVSNGMLQLADDTGTSTDQLVQGMFMIESSGYHGAAGLAVLKAAAEGAKVGGADLGSVANALTTVLANYGDKGVTAAEATNTLIQIVANGKSHMQDLAASISTVLPAAAKYGVSLTDVSAALATMTAQNGDAASSSTYLKQLLTSLAAPSSSATKSLTAIGLSAQQVADEMRVSLPDTLQMITDAIGKKFPAGSVAATDAFKNIAGGAKQMQGMLLLTGPGMDKFKGDVATIGSAVKNSGDSIQGWSTVQGTFNLQMSRASESVKSLMIAIGTNLLPVVTQAAKFFADNLPGAIRAVTPVVRALAQAFAENLPGAIRAVTTGFTDVARVVLAVAHGVGSVISFFESTGPAAMTVKGVLVVLGGAMAGLAASTIPALIASLVAYATTAIPAAITAIMTSVTAFGAQAAAAAAAAVETLAATWPFIAMGAAIALVVIGIYELITHWSQVSKFLEGVWAATVKGVQAGFTWLANGAAELWASIVSAFTSGVNAVVGFFTGAWSNIVASFNLGVSLVKGIIQSGFTFIKDFIKLNIEAIVMVFDWLFQHNRYFRDLVNIIKADFEFAKNVISIIWNDIKTFLVTTWNKIAGLATAAFDFVKGIIVAEFNFYKLVITTVWNAVVVFLKTTWDIIKTDATAVFDWLRSFFVGAFDFYWNIITTVWNAVMGYLKGVWATIKTDVVNAWTAVTSFIGSQATTFSKVVKTGVIDPITNTITSLISGAEAWGQNLIKTFIRGIQNMAGEVKNAAKNVAANVANFLGFQSPAKEGPGSTADQWAPNLVKMFTAGLTAGAGDAARAAATLMGGVAGAFGGRVGPGGVALGIGGGVAPSAAMSLLSSSPAAIGAQVAAANMAGGASGGAPTQVILQLDGQRVGTALLPHIGQAARIATGVRMM